MSKEKLVKKYRKLLENTVIESPNGESAVVVNITDPEYAYKLLVDYYVYNGYDKKEVNEMFDPELYKIVYALSGYDQIENYEVITWDSPNVGVKSILFYS